MAKEITSKKVALNIILSVLAQVVSLLTSLVLNLIVPKFIPNLEYSYWQTYIMYSGQVVILHFGIIDGLLLRYSQYDYNEIDKSRLRSQFKIVLAITTVCAVICAICGLTILEGSTRLIVVLVAASVVTKNIILYTSSTLQATNRINRYALFIILQKFCYGVFVVVLLILKVQDFYWYCIGDLFGDLISIAICPFINRGMYLGKSIKGRQALEELKSNISAGIMLMIANYSAVLLTNGAKMVVNWHFDELVFSTVSFAFSVTSLFLTFVSAISIVLFPSLKRINTEKLVPMYGKLRTGISILLFVILICYFPGCWILKRWLPQYEDSLVYLGILLPIIVFSSKVGLLTNNYLKFYRKEKTMFVINLCSAIVGMIAFLICAYAFDNLYAILISVVVVVMLNSVISEIAVSKIIKTKLVWDFILEFAMTAGFIVAVYYLGNLHGMLVYIGMLVIYLALNAKRIIDFAKGAAKRKKREGIEEEEK